MKGFIHQNIFYNLDQVVRVFFRTCDDNTDANITLSFSDSSQVKIGKYWNEYLYTKLLMYFTHEERE